MAQNHNRSSEELQMREIVVAWGRKRWPDARVFHELTINQNRVDLAFIRPTDLIAVEIKSSKDNLDRAEKQLRVFKDTFPRFIVAHAPKHTIEHPMRLVVDAGAGTIVQEGWGWHRDRMNWRVFTAMLDLLWADEARAICHRQRISVTSRTTMEAMMPKLARHLTGEQILHEVCRELRGRHTFVEASDAPIADATLPADSPLLV